jgi:ACS family D-galactonate transporter-like MFS transporter
LLSIKTKPLTSVQRWTVVGLLFLGMIISYVDRSNITAALTVPEFRQLFNLNSQDVGVLQSAFFWSYAFLQVPAGYVVDRYGVKGPYAIAFVFWSLVSAGTAMTSSFSQLFGLRLLLGVGESVVTPASLRWIRYNVEEKQRGLAVGILFAGAKMGPAIGTPLAVFLLAQFGWRSMFAILGFGALLWLIPWALMVRSDDRELEADATKASLTPPVPFSSIFRTPVIYGIMIGTFCYNYFVYFNMTWLPLYFVNRRHLTQKDMAIYTFFTFTGMAVTAIAAGWFADRLISRGADPVTIRKRFTVAGFLVASTEIIGAMSNSNEVALTFAIVSLAGLGLATGNYWALTQTLMPGAAMGRIAGLQNFASNSSGIVAAWFSGWLIQKTGSYDAPMQAIWLILITGVASYSFLVRKKYAQ